LNHFHERLTPDEGYFYCIKINEPEGGTSEYTHEGRIDYRPGCECPFCEAKYIAIISQKYSFFRGPNPRPLIIIDPVGVEAAANRSEAIPRTLARVTEVYEDSDSSEDEHFWLCMAQELIRRF
jgi:hypothetical protein